MYQIRKCETVTTLYGSDVANLDPEKFRDLSKPYEGNSEKEFLDYISELIYDYDDIIEELEEKLSREIIVELEKLYESPENVIWNSTEKGSDSWFELGEEDETYRKSGGFNVKFETQN